MSKQRMSKFDKIYMAAWIVITLVAVSGLVRAFFDYLATCMLLGCL